MSPLEASVIELTSLMRVVRDDAAEVAGSVRETRNEVAKLDISVALLNQMSSAIVKRQSDHESRVRRLERWMWALPVAALTGGAGALVNWLLQH